MKLKNSLLLTCIFFSFAPVEAVPTAIGLYIKGNKKLLICGDLHTARISGDATGMVEKLDAAPVKALQKLLQQLAKNSSKSACIVELYTATKHYQLLAQKYMLNPDQRDCLNTMQYEAIKNKLKLGNLNFVPGDIRVVTDELPGLISEVTNNSRHLTNPLSQDIALQVFKELHANTTFAAYFTEAKATISSLKKQIAALTDLPEQAQKYLKDYLTTAEANIVKREKMVAELSLAGMKHNIMSSPLFNILFDSLVNHKATLLKKLNSTQFLNELSGVSSYIADLGLMQKLLESINQYDTTVVYVGLTHMRALDAFVKELGFTVLEKADAAPNFTQGYMNYETENDIIRMALPATSIEILFAKFMQPSTPQGDAKAGAERVESKTATAGSTPQETPSQTTMVAAKICAQCHKTEAEKRCSACKTVNYCSAECQRAHWKQHKIACKQLVKTA